MKLALIYGSWCLSFRKSLDFEKLWGDPRGLTGSELGLVRISEELVKLGHEVHLYTVSRDVSWRGVRIHPIEDLEKDSFDAAISINEPDQLKRANAKLRICEQWLNSFDYCKVGFDKHVDLWISPSEGHRQMVVQTEHDVELLPSGAKARYKPDPKQWHVIPLGCDPERYQGHGDKVPGRAIYCSSPDRGLHWLLQEWPHIKRAVPHATLKIFYRLKPWIDGLKATDYFPPIEKLRARAMYIEEALRRMPGDEWGIELCDSVSRERIEREMAVAECLAFPTDTVRWSEGFSVTTLEGCAAAAAPVIWDTDALGGIYDGACSVMKRGDVLGWRNQVIKMLTDAEARASVNQFATAFASKLTWKARTETLAELIREKLSDVRAA